MTCPHCRHENESDAHYCTNCGQALRITCPKCGEEARPNQNFCANCGQDLRTSPRTPGVGPKAYTPAHLAEKIIASRHSLTGERKRVTVMFADIVDSTSAIEKADAEEAADYLSKALDGMMEAIHRYEGTVNELRGDGLMALFGAPLAHEDHAVRAARAALAIPNSVAAATGGQARTRVGLHSGEVFVRGVGNDLSVEYQALGPTVHLAARMEALAEPGTAAVTVDVQRLIEGHIDTHRIGPIDVKGISEPVDVFQLDQPLETSQWAVRATRGLTEFTGRNREIEQLTLIRDRLASSSGRAVALRGEAGVGKSRLIHEFVARTPSDQFTVLKAEASPFEATTPYFPIKSLIYSWLDTESGDPGVESKLLEALEEISRDLRHVAPAFAWLIDLPVDDPDWDQLSPRQRSRKARDAVKATLHALARQRPVIVVVEDLHWIDGETKAAIDEIAAIASGLPLMLLVTYRPEFEERWDPPATNERLDLEPLSGDSSLDFVDHLLGDDPSLSEFKPQVVERSEGTPLFIEETVRTLAEMGVLVGKRGAYTSTAKAVPTDIPDSVQAVLAARIDRLDSIDKRVLQVAAVASEDIPVDMISGVIGQTNPETLASLTRLQERDFIHEQQVLPTRRYRFAHALVRDVAYESLPKQERREMHEAMVRLLEGPDHTGYSEHLAYHSTRAGLWQEAVNYSQEAANRAIERSAFREAAAFLRQASKALQNLPQTEEVINDRINITLRLRVAETGAEGGLARIIEDLSEASKLAASLEDPHLQGRVAIHHGYTANMLGHSRLAESQARIAHGFGEETGDQYLTVESQLLLAQSHLYAGRFNQVIPAIGDHLPYLIGEIRHETQDQTMIRSVVACAHMAVAHAAAGDVSESERWQSEGLAIADEVNRPFDRMYMQLARGKCLDFLSRYQEAVAAHEASAQIADDADIWFMKTFALPWRGHALYMAGRHDEAMAVVQTTMLDADRVQLPSVVAECRAVAALVHNAKGEMAAAREQAELASEFGSARDLPVVLVLAAIATDELDLAGELASRHGMDTWANSLREASD